jgi:WD40 repeat protein
VKPAGPLERGYKWAKRRPAAAALTATVLLFALFGVANLWWQGRKDAAHLKESEANLYFSRIRQAEGYVALGQPDRAEEVLEECPRELRQWEWHYLWRRCHRKPITLWGHRSPIKAVQYSPDGSCLATASLDGTAILWDPKTGRPRHTLEHGIGVTSVCFTGGGRFVVTAAEDRIVRVWDAAAGTKLAEMRFPGQTVGGGGTSDRFAALDRGTVVTIWRVGAGGAEEIFPPLPQERMVNSLALSPDGSRLGVAGYRNLLEVWDLSKKDPARLWELTLPNRPWNNAVWSVAFSPDGKQLLAGGEDVREWDVETGKHLRVLSGIGDAGGESLTYGPPSETDNTSERVAATDHNGHVRVWERATGKTVVGPKRTAGPVQGVAFDPRDGRYLAVIRGPEVTIEDLTPQPAPPGRVLTTGDKVPIEALAVSPDERRLAWRAGNEVILWDTDGDRVRRFKLEWAGEAREAGLAFSRDGRLLVAAGAGDALWVWDVERGQKCDVPAVTGEDLRCAAFSHDNQHLAVSGWGGRISFWNVADGTKEAGEASAAGIVLALSFRPGPGAPQLVSCGNEGSVQRWDLTGKELCRYKGHSNAVTAAAFSPGDGRLLATSSADGTVRLWDTDSGAERRVLTLGTYVSGVAFHKDGRRLATCGSDGTVKLWDVDSGREVLTLTGHRDHPVSGVAFSPSGRLLISCGHDGTVCLWDAAAP